MVILAEILDNVYRSSGHVARSLGIPILESVDEIITSKDRRRHLIQSLVIAPIILIVGLTCAGMTGAMAYLNITEPTAYEKLRRIPTAAIEFFAGSDSTDSDNELDNVS